VEKIMKKMINVFVVAVAMLFVSNPAFAEGATAQTGDAGWIGMAAGLAIGLAAFGGALGQGNTAKSAMEAMGRNPNANVQTPMIIAMALTESLVILGFIIAYSLQGKI
jgi:F-type H+-transporting ATPase subunit c